jgi:hypothetical protein
VLDPCYTYLPSLCVPWAIRLWARVKGRHGSGWSTLNILIEERFFLASSSQPPENPCRFKFTKYVNFNESPSDQKDLCHKTRTGSIACVCTPKGVMTHRNSNSTLYRTVLHTTRLCYQTNWRIHFSPWELCFGGRIYYEGGA